MAKSLTAALAASAWCDPALADEAFKVSGYFNLDVIEAVSGGARRKARELDKLHIDMDSDLETAIGWTGAKGHLSLLNVSGGQPNADIGTLQGVDNIEVERHRTRVYEAWVDQGFADGKASLLAGLYDLNSEFYASEPAAYLFGPAFGIGTELAATGPNGPAIYPSTALAVRLAFTPTQTSYARVAALNARAGTFGDPGGVYTGMKDGALLIAEAGWSGPARLGFGAWTYTRKQDDLVDVTASGAPVERSARGAYVLGDGPLWGEEGRSGRTLGFFRVGVSDGRTGDFRGGWQAGVLVSPVFEGRDDSAFSAGVATAWLSKPVRAAMADPGTETQIELTYADQVTPWLAVQPNLQYVIDPGGDRLAKNALVAGIRFTLSYGD